MVHTELQACVAGFLRKLPSQGGPRSLVHKILLPASGGAVFAKNPATRLDFGVTSGKDFAANPTKRMTS